MSPELIARVSPDLIVSAREPGPDRERAHETWRFL